MYNCGLNDCNVNLPLIHINTVIQAIVIWVDVFKICVYSHSSYSHTNGFDEKCHMRKSVIIIHTQNRFTSMLEADSTVWLNLDGDSHPVTSFILMDPATTCSLMQNFVGHVTSFAFSLVFFSLLKTSDSVGPIPNKRETKNKNDTQFPIFDSFIFYKWNGMYFRTFNI